ncbi:MAG: hypothetical protein COY42_11580 [Armatimonadetes bacterium CG_4_10_14_0_8_um_filter_66_14]|nr:PEGA domain-containing protein [Armatimonadota bacterium]OIP02400.1 MAG: hypothetical protein AUJ96_16355 [Armatimonadetes bacterium CG2_30_66_41]PIX49690.1 MAG: hypothetical protein COZ57_02770 [Armatimonadetes bacterium CG_4_8_14_3_um_filter_66_20]PIZ45770.1 MAG: hypothetical protein COY42_11580 [Armatimonadetes bacterium CG_4_10_14_0_8_um_filter_66_14]PJB60689.1 MAG: hypothetical protein CO096_32660 [Armatimonadetes bacterium CG_4_9_14_3_um_filter_66_14]
MSKGILHSLVRDRLRRPVALSLAVALVCCTCPLPARAADLTAALAVMLAPATGDPGVSGAVLSQVNEGLRVALTATDRYRLLESDTLAEGVDAARTWTSVTDEQLRSVAGKLGADVVLAPHVSLAQAAARSVAEVLVSLRLVDVVAGSVVADFEVAGVSSMAPVSVESKFSEALNGASREAVRRLTEAASYSLGIGAYGEKGRVFLGGGSDQRLSPGSWLMVFRGARHVGALQVVECGTTEAIARIRYLKGVQSLTASDRARFAFAPPPPTPAEVERTQVARARRSNRSKTIVGLLVAAGLAALLLGNRGDSSPAATGGTPGGAPATGTGNWQIASTPAGAAVTLDGQATGRTTPTTFNSLASGDHTVTLTLAGFNAHTVTVTLVAGQTKVDTVQLVAGGGPPDAPPAPI